MFTNESNTVKECNKNNIIKTESLQNIKRVMRSNKVQRDTVINTKFLKNLRQCINMSSYTTSSIFSQLVVVLFLILCLIMFLY